MGCSHSALSHYCWWNKYVANPIKKFGYVGRGRSAMRLLKHEILDRVLLRRTKVQCADVLALPPRCVSTSLIFLGNMPSFGNSPRHGLCHQDVNQKLYSLFWEVVSVVCGLMDSSATFVW